MKSRLIFRHPLFLAGGIMLLGLAVNFIIQVVMSLVYRNYQVLGQPGSYFNAVGLTFVIYFGIRAINNFLAIRFPWRESPISRFLWQAILNISFAVLTVIAAKILVALISFSNGFTSLTDTALVVTVVAAVTLIVVLTDLSIYLLDNWRNSLAEVEKFQKESVEFQLQMLKAQVNPHFLFNSLNTLSSLIFQDQETAAGFVRQLSKVYRYVLESRNKEIISLEEELSVMEAYIFLLEIRFAKNLMFSLDILPKHRQMLIAPMTLQMLVENAIKHNVVSSKKPLNVSIQSHGEDQLSVTNNLQVKEVLETSTGMGLRNIRGRYAHLTSRRIEVKEDQQQFSVSIPLIASYESRDH